MPEVFLSKVSGAMSTMTIRSTLLAFFVAYRIECHPPMEQPIRVIFLKSFISTNSVRSSTNRSRA